MVSCMVHIWVAQNQECACRWTTHKAGSGFQHGNTRVFCANQGASNMKAVLGEQLVKIVARNTARNLGKALSNQVSVFVTQGFHVGVYLASPSTFLNNACEFLIAGLANPHAQTIIGENI